MDAYDRELVSARLDELGKLPEFLKAVTVLRRETGVDLGSAWDTVIELPKYGGAGIADEVSDEEAYWSALTVSAMDRDAPARDIAVWVFDRMHAPIERINPDDVPSGGAITMLRWARDGNLTDFMRTIYAKLMPSKSEIEEDEKHRGSGRLNQRTLDEVAIAAKQSVADAAEQTYMIESDAKGRVEAAVEEEIRQRITGEAGAPI